MRLLPPRRGPHSLPHAGEYLQMSEGMSYCTRMSPYTASPVLYPYCTDESDALVRETQAAERDARWELRSRQYLAGNHCVTNSSKSLPPNAAASSLLRCTVMVLSGESCRVVVLHVISAQEQLWHPYKRGRAPRSTTESRLQRPDHKPVKAGPGLQSFVRSRLASVYHSTARCLVSRCRIYTTWSVIRRIMLQDSTATG